MSQVAIVGGGVAGLALAEALERLHHGDDPLDLVVLEASERAGGNIRTDVIDGYVCERGPNGFLDNAPATLALVDRLGLAGRLLVSTDAARRRFIFTRGRLYEVPTSPMGFLRSKLLSWPGRLRAALELFVRPARDADETIYDFAARHLGREAADTLVDPMVSGVFAGDARQLSLGAAFPKMARMEREHRSLIRAALAHGRSQRTGAKAAFGAPGGRLTSFVGGFEELPTALADRLGPRVRTNMRVTAIQRIGAREGCDGCPRYRLSVAQGAPIDVDAAVFAGPARETAAILEGVDYAIAQSLGEIPAAPLAVVCLGYAEQAVAADRGPLDGFGFLVPRQEHVRLLGALWESTIYPGRAPRGHVLVRAMIGGALDPGAVDLTDPELVHLVRCDLAATMRVSIAPEFVQVFHHRIGIPQYTVGHLDRLGAIERRLQVHPGLFLAGNSYRGISVNACIEDAEVQAHRILGWLRATAACVEAVSAREPVVA